MTWLLFLVALLASDVRPLSLAQVCGTAWAHDPRHVSLTTKKAVFKRAGICWCDRAKYIVDHRVPRELGGADTLDNLWIQTPPVAHRKDVEENRLRRAVCRGEVLLKDAQAQMREWKP